MRDQDYPIAITCDEGLQVEVHKGPEIIPRDTELPQPISPHLSSRTTDSLDESMHKELNLPPRPGLFSRKRCIPIALVLILILAGAILAGIFGWKATHPPSSPVASAAASNTPSPPTFSNQRIKSTHGAWNATGIAAFTSALPAFWGFVIYQDYTGVLNEARWTLNDSNVAVLNTRSLPVSAAQGTGLVGSIYRLDSENYYYHVIYVNQENILTDMWRNWTSVDAPWKQGNLSTLNFHAPTDNRPALSVEFDGNVPQDSKGPNATRLWAGGTDGALHQLLLNWTDWTWLRQDTALVNSYAYGAAASAYGYGKDGTANTTVYNTLPDGTLQLQFSIDGDPQAARSMWPHGDFLEPVNTTVKMAPNSSAFAHWNTSCPINKCDSYLIYPDNNGRLTRLLLDSARDDAQQIGNLDTSFNPYQIMVGSDLAGTQGNNNSVLFYQANGSDISWLLTYDNGTQANSGQLNIP